jgi:predicted metal-binding membrane protein
VTLLERWGGRHPEWAAAALAAAGWALLIAPHGGGSEHAHHAVAVANRSADLPHWLVMSVAMMVPSAIPAVRGVALTSLRSRRQRAVALFLGSYVAVWVLFGTLAIQAVDEVRRLVGVGSPALLAGALVVAGAWELTPAKRRALRACHLSRPILPRGWRADAGCARAGLLYGRRCVVACWALMVVMVAPGHVSFPLMLLLAAIIGAEKLLVRGPRLTAAAAPVLLGAAFLVAMG